MRPHTTCSTDVIDASEATRSPVRAIEVFAPPWWLPGAHLQTIAPALFAARPSVGYTRERWITPDDDFIDVDCVAPLAAAHGAGTTPTLVVFHGLEGSAQSRYVRDLMAAAAARGWRGVAPHFRGCGGTLNRAPRFYHSGDSGEVDWILERAARSSADAADSHAPLFAVGVSLGGNALLKWLGEQGQAARVRVTRAAAISAPLDLTASGAALSRGLNMVYTRVFLRTLKAKSAAKLAQYPKLFDRDAMLAARDLHAFDDIVTAPLHGFRDADDYWRRASSKPLLPRIAVPTLVLNAKNDPFLPAAALPDASEVSTAVTLDFPDEGGHVGFFDPRFLHGDWMTARVMDFLTRG